MVTRQPAHRYVVWGGVLFFLLLSAGEGMFFVFLSRRPDIDLNFLLVFVCMTGINGAVLVILTALFRRFLSRPLSHLTQGIEIVAGVNAAYEIELPRYHLLGSLPKAVAGLSTAFMRAKREMAETLAAGADEIEDRRLQLETVLNTLKEGVIVCDERARILFYNSAARKIFYDNEALGLGRSLYLLCARVPVENALSILRQQHIRHEEVSGDGQAVRFVSSTLKEGILLSCHVHLLPVMMKSSWSFIFTCEHISDQMDRIGQTENQLRMLVTHMRAPLTTLGVSVDSLHLYPDLAAGDRAKFEEIIAQETRTLIRYFDSLADEIQGMVSSHYVETEVFTGDIIACAAKKLRDQGLQLTMIGDPLWVLADSISLLLLLECLALKIREYCGVKAIEIQTLLGDRRVYFDYCWHGTVVPQSQIQQWLSQVIWPAGFTVGEVLERHRSDIWSSPHAIPGYAVLRLPVPASPRQWEALRPVLPERPVYYDFTLREPPTATASLYEFPIGSLTYVVFDAETTGLAPLEGDEIVSLAGVKILNGGIIVGETFDRIVNPGRPIPQESIRFHGITDEIVKDKPGIREVLRSFHAFVGDAVLVGHNAAFDMRFIRMKEEEAGVRFLNPILDTLMLSLYLHDHTPEHSLDALAQRFGVRIRDRHTALGDSLITAEVFLRLLYLLAERGFTTLGNVIEVARR